MIAAVLDPVACVGSLWSQRVASVLPGMTMTSPLGEFIRHQRELQDLSMRQLADLVGISNPYLSQIERGLREPSERVLEAIARSLETSTDELYETAGIVREPVAEDEVGTREAIEADDHLTGRQRRALLEVYDSFLAVNRRSRS
jgi:transcriptional regulator with XRE-family HTH domain